MMRYPCPPPPTGVSDPWNYDTIEIGWANYDVRDVGGDVNFGTPHAIFKRGEHADYQFRIGGRDAGTSAFAEVATPSVGEVGSAVYDVLMGSTGNSIGYKILANMPLDKIQDVSTGDVVLPPPVAGDPIRFIAIDIVLNDRDAGIRQSQIQTSRKHNAGSQWWNTPAQWDVVALSPRDQYNIATETELPSEFALDQNYPNPFNPQTLIGFSLSSAERVTLTVHDMLGRTVATLLSQQPMSSGSHVVPFNGQGLASGVYVYRLKAGAAFTAAKRMILIR